MTEKKYPEPAPFSKAKRPAIALTGVKSSQVKAIGYDPATKTLAVQFVHGVGALYCYPNVTSETHEAFVKAKSIGSFFGQHIKHLPFEKFPPESAAAAAAPGVDLESDTPLTGGAHDSSRPESCDSCQ